MQFRQQARRLAVAFRHRAFAVDHRLGAEILDQKQARVEVLAVDLRRGEAEGPQPAIDGDEGVNAFGELATAL